MAREPNKNPGLVNLGSAPKKCKTTKTKHYHCK